MTIGLMSNDQILFQIDDKTGLQFDFVAERKHLLYLGREQNQGGSTFFLVFMAPYFSSRALMLVLEWATEHRDDPTPVPGEKFVPTEFDMNFFKIDEELLFDCFLVVDHLGNERLRELACQYLARSIVGKSTEEVKAFFDDKMCCGPRFQSFDRLNSKFKQQKPLQFMKFEELQNLVNAKPKSGGDRNKPSILNLLVEQLKTMEKKQTKTIIPIDVGLPRAGPSNNTQQTTNNSQKKKKKKKKKTKKGGK